MAVENEQALGNLHAQRAELVEQHGAVLEQVSEPAGAPGVPGVPVTPEAPEAPEALEPVDVDADPGTRPCTRTSGSPTSAW